MTQTTNPALRQRWFRFSLWTLLLAFVPLALSFAWWRDHHDLARQAEDAKNLAMQEVRDRLIWEVRYKHLRLGLKQIGIGLEHSGSVFSDSTFHELLAKKQEVDELLRKERVSIGWMDDLRPFWVKDPSDSTSEEIKHKLSVDEVKQRMEFYEKLRDSGVSGSSPKDQP